MAGLMVRDYDLLCAAFARRLNPNFIEPFVDVLKLAIPKFRPVTVDGIVMQNRVLQSLPDSARSSIGIEPNGSLDIRHAAWNAFWQGRGQRRPLTGLNEPANRGGITLYTPAWGPATPSGSN